MISGRSNVPVVALSQNKEKHVYTRTVHTNKMDAAVASVLLQGREVTVIASKQACEYRITHTLHTNQGNSEFRECSTSAAAAVQMPCSHLQDTVKSPPDLLCSGSLFTLFETRPQLRQRDRLEPNTRARQHSLRATKEAAPVLASCDTKVM